MKSDLKISVVRQRSGKSYLQQAYCTLIYPQDRRRVTPWVLFIIFILGPCEPLIPFLTYPAAQNSTAGIIWLVSIFTLFTLVTMVTIVLLGYYGVTLVKSTALERYIHAIGVSYSAELECYI